MKTAALGGLQLTAPERVNREVLGKSKDPLFSGTPVRVTWLKLKANGHVAVLPDELTTVAFTDAVTRISGMPAEKRVMTTKSLGEIMVLAHASALAQAGIDVFVLMDERDGRDRCDQEQQWLARNSAPGRVTLWATKQVLKQSDPSWIVGDRTWQQVYNQMRPFDLALTAL